ncbi:MAG TPA: biotin--[acetyl-CoA-carboxylase] ligase [Gemmataceae bacterium]|jgi:BirA family biotin operon repressor/biotin-[acetyl-CoA-carboxylase] ligase
MTLPREEWSLDTRRLGRRVLVYDRLDSTNSLAAQLADDPANDGIAILADEQTAGRGQHGRTWLAAPGQSVLLSILVSPPQELCRPAVLTAWAAVAVCTTIRETIGCETRIKWPNDVYLHGRKVCGILIESVAGRRAGGVSPLLLAQQGANAPRSPCFITGIGLNVQQSAEAFAAAGLPEATSLAQYTASPLDTYAVAAALIRQLDRDYDLLCQGDLGTLEARWRERLGLLGKHVVAECPDATHRGRLIELSFRAVELARSGEPSLVLAPERIQHLWEAAEPIRR